MSKKKVIIIILICLIILAAGGLVAYKTFYKEEAKIKTAKKLDSIKGFDYHLEDRDTELYKKEFKQLKANLESSTIDYEAYAKSIAKMYIIDLYTLDNKINKYDVGGTEFIHPDALENYELNVKDTLYKYIADNSSSDRTQELPEVKDIAIKSFEESQFKIGDDETDSYEVTLNWTYVKDLKYDTDAVVIIVKKDKKLYVVEQKEVEEETITK